MAIGLKGSVVCSVDPLLFPSPPSLGCWCSLATRLLPRVALSSWSNSRMQQAVAGMFQAVADNFAENLQPIAAECAGKQARAASELADTLLGVVEGSIILAKAHRDPTRIPKAIRGFRRSLERLVAEPA